MGCGRLVSSTLTQGGRRLNLTGEDRRGGGWTQRQGG